MAALSPLQPALTTGSGEDGKKKEQLSPQAKSARATDTGGQPLLPKSAAALANANISSPHELTDWVDSVLDQLESRFESMSGQVETRMKEMSDRIDALESSIEELISGVNAPPTTTGKGTLDADVGGQSQHEKP